MNLQNFSTEQNTSFPRLCRRKDTSQHDITYELESIVKAVYVTSLIMCNKTLPVQFRALKYESENERKYILDSRNLIF